MQNVQKRSQSKNVVIKSALGNLKHTAQKKKKKKSLASAFGVNNTELLKHHTLKLWNKQQPMKDLQIE